MRVSRTLAVIVTIAGLGTAGCAPPVQRGSPGPSATPTTTIDTGPHACTYITDAEARTALDQDKLPRKAASSTASAHTFCIFRTADENTDLVVTGGGEGAPAFDAELVLAERDMSAKRTVAVGVTDGYVISGVQLGKPIVLVGAVRGPHWFTAVLRIADASKSTLETRAMVVLRAGVPRLET